MADTTITLPFILDSDENITRFYEAVKDVFPKNGGIYLESFKIGKNFWDQKDFKSFSQFRDEIYGKDHIDLSELSLAYNDSNHLTNLFIFYSPSCPNIVTIKGQPYDFFAKAVENINNNLFQPQTPRDSSCTKGIKPKKIFISHSECDVKYAEYIVNLLYNIGVPKQEGNILCTSVDGCRIPLGSDIYEYLREQFENYDLLILFLLSENYYKSPASLNEMGAAWVLRSNYRTILLPGFEYKSIKGAIDPMKVSMKLDAASVKDYLEDLKTQVEEFFDLTPIAHRIWENDRDQFLKSIKESSISNKQI
jgi:hypothetical protein